MEARRTEKGNYFIKWASGMWKTLTKKKEKKIGNINTCLGAFMFRRLLIKLLDRRGLKKGFRAGKA